MGFCSLAPSPLLPAPSPLHPPPSSLLPPLAPSLSSLPLAACSQKPFPAALNLFHNLYLSVLTEKLGNMTTVALLKLAAIF